MRHALTQLAISSGMRLARRAPGPRTKLAIFLGLLIRNEFLVRVPSEIEFSNGQQSTTAPPRIKLAYAWVKKIIFVNDPEPAQVNHIQSSASYKARLVRLSMLRRSVCNPTKQ